MSSYHTYTPQSYLRQDHTCVDRTPYCYLIGWSKLNKWYYGRRTAKNCHPSDLWVSYFTSSKHVKKFRREHGEPDVVQIRRVFDNVESCCIWEDRVLEKMKVESNERFLNRRVTNSKWNSTGCVWIKGVRYTSEEYKEDSSLIFHTKNSTVVTYDNGTTYVRIPKDHPDILSGLAVSNTKGYKIVRDCNNVAIRVPVDDNRYNHINSKKVIAKFSIESKLAGNIIKVPVDDIRFHTGELVGIQCDETLYHIILEDGSFKSCRNLRKWCIDNYGKLWKSVWHLLKKRGSYGKWRSKEGRIYLITETIGL
jgi:hypothetical protein